MASKRKNYSAQLKENYRKLREAGFTSKEAQRYRGASQENINKAIQQKTLPQKSVQHQIARSGKTREVMRQRRGPKKSAWERALKRPEGIKGQIKSNDYETVKAGDRIIYNRSYSYVVWFATADRAGNYTQKWVIVTSDEPMNKTQVKDKFLNEIAEANDSKYEGERIIKGSITITAAYHNPVPGVGL